MNIPPNPSWTSIWGPWTCPSGGVAGTGITEKLKEAAGKLYPFAEYRRWGMYAIMGLTMAGLGLILWPHYDDWRKGLR